MPYTTNVAGHIVELTFTGPIAAADMHAASAETIDLQKRTRLNRFLIDADSWALDASTSDIYKLPAETYGKEKVDPRTRIAILMPRHESARRGALFYEDACRNRGWNARVFDDRAAAVEWLLQPG